MAAMLKTALAAICVLVMLAVAYLTLSVVVLRPPRVNDPGWLGFASIVVALAAFTLAALSRLVRVRGPVIAEGAVVVLLGGWMIQRTLASAHFEGYALLLGAMLAVQGTLTIVVFSLRRLVA